MPGVCDSAGPAMHLRCRTPPCCLPYSVTPSAPWIARFRSSSTSGIPSLHMPLSNASSAASRLPSHGSGSGWFATPFLYDSFIHYFTPVYPDAIHAKACATTAILLRLRRWGLRLARDGRPGCGRCHGRRGRPEIIVVHDHGRGGLQIVHGLLDHFRVQFP